MHRRRFLVATAVAALGAFGALPRPLRAIALARDPVKHPDPREGITAERVLAEDEVPEKHRRAYAAAREFPAIMDGLYCHCGCADRDGLRSLLSCFETKMPLSCGICRGEAELAGRLARDGKSLAEIREAVDRKYE